ncbi:MAG: PEBP family protein [Planctomycetota bacterium]
MAQKQLAWTVGCAFVLLCNGCRKPEATPRALDTEGSIRIEADVWADNWFALYLGEDLLIEDSVSITTERSFNAERFTFAADDPIVLNFVVKDFKEDDSGLEYIGTRKQQMGDGGFIAQFVNADTGELLVATDASWKCLVLHHGPNDASCASLDDPIAGRGPCAFESRDEPAGWKTLDYSTADWPNAREFSESAVRPKDGYDRVRWVNEAKLIWSDDLKKDNTILFRVTIDLPSD